MISALAPFTAVHSPSPFAVCANSPVKFACVMARTFRYIDDDFEFVRAIEVTAQDYSLGERLARAGVAFAGGALIILMLARLP